MAVAQDHPPLHGRGHRGHTGGVLGHCAPLSALLPDTGLGGSVVAGHASDKIENTVPVQDCIISHLKYRWA